MLASTPARVARSAAGQVGRLEEATFAGRLRNSEEAFEYSVRLLRGVDTKQISRLQALVLDPLPKPWPLYARDTAFFDRCISDHGCIVGAFHDGELIGYATLYVPREEDENYGRDLEFPADELRKVAHLAGSAVHPRYRGNRIQVRLADIRETWARWVGFHHLCGEVVPQNFVSIKNHLDLGYHLKGFRVDRFNEPNYMLDKDLRRSASRQCEREVRVIRSDDIPAYRAMLNAGLWGFRAITRRNRPSIVCGRFA